jgi:hypothetical protein
MLAGVSASRTEPKLRIAADASAKEVISATGFMAGDFWSGLCATGSALAPKGTDSRIRVIERVWKRRVAPTDLI